MVVLLINPNTSRSSTRLMLAAARGSVGDRVRIRGATASSGPPMIVDAEALEAAGPEVVRLGLARERDIAAIVVAAFGDPGAARLRELVPVPVIGIGEAAIREAAARGRRFGIATTTSGLVEAIEGLVRVLGHHPGMTGIRVPPHDPVALSNDPDRQEAALAEAVRACIERDGAEAVIIGGGPLSETAARLRGRFAVEIVEPVPAAMRAALAALSPPGI